MNIVGTHLPYLGHAIKLYMTKGYYHDYVHTQNYGFSLYHILSQGLSAQNIGEGLTARRKLQLRPLLGIPYLIWGTVFISP